MGAGTVFSGSPPMLNHMGTEKGKEDRFGSS